MNKIEMAKRIEDLEAEVEYVQESFRKMVLENNKAIDLRDAVISELLEALKGLESFFEKAGFSTSFLDEARAAMRVATAISKAEGQTNESRN